LVEKSSSISKQQPSISPSINSKTSAKQHKEKKSKSFSTQPPTQTTYVSLLEKLDKKIVGFQKMVDSRPKSWLVRGYLIRHLNERARLTGSFKDLARTQEILDEAFSLAPKGSGPLMEAAQFNYSVHRLDKALQYLDQFKNHISVKQQTYIAILFMRANISFHHGQYDEAFEGYQIVTSQNAQIGLPGLATYYSKIGDFSSAKKHLQQALNQKPSPDVLHYAWLKLQLGIVAMEVGQYEDALKYLEEGDEAVNGWWLIQEHIAEVYTLLGQDSKAVSIYEEVIKNTGSPQYMDALASCYLRMGSEDKAKELIHQAEELWEARLKQFPEASGGHGVEHYLEFGDSTKALELAKANFKVRPGGEARIFLAQAFIKLGHFDKAVLEIEAVLESSFRTADLHWVASEAYAGVGSIQKSQKQRAKCLQINPNHPNIHP
jgi:tetratricopeptide (TPR) repeat protein